MLSPKGTPSDEGPPVITNQKRAWCSFLGRQTTPTAKKRKSLTTPKKAECYKILPVDYVSLTCFEDVGSPGGQSNLANISWQYILVIRQFCLSCNSSE